LTCRLILHPQKKEHYTIEHVEQHETNKNKQLNHPEEKWQFVTNPCNNYLLISQTTFTTKIPLIMLNKLHITLVTNDNELWMKKNYEIHMHILTSHICIVIYN
jgi:hypothetical protein